MSEQQHSGSPPAEVADVTAAPKKNCPESAGHGKRSRLKSWTYRIMAAMLALGALGLVELALRGCGVGADLNLIQPAPGEPAQLTHRFNGPADLPFYGLANLTGPEPRRFALPKPENTFRIVFLGGSTVIGFPYLPEVAFPRHVEVLLERQNQGLDVEVLNAAMTAINSFAVVDLLQQCLECDPDLIVIHSGHNEFYGPGGPASNAVSLPYHLVGPIFAMRRWRIAQLIERLGRPSAAPQDDLLDTLPRALEIPLEGPIFKQAKRNYRRNLLKAVAVAERHGVPLLLSTVASNLKDQSPLNAYWPDPVSDDQKAVWEKSVQRGESLLRGGDAARALESFLAAEQIEPDHAQLSYRKAQCLELLGRDTEAFAAYEKARDEDACRFRAPSVFAEIVEDVAGTSENTSFLDIAELVHQESSQAAPGSDYFFEHVHYTFDGHLSLGRFFARFIQEQILGRPWLPEAAPADVEMVAALGVVPEDHLAACSSIMKVLETGPLESALDSDQHKQVVVDQITQLYYELDAPRREAFAEVPMASMATNLIEVLAVIHRHRGNAELSELFSELAKIRRPWNNKATSRL